MEKFSHSVNVIRPKVQEHMGKFDGDQNLVMYLPFYHVYGKVTLMAALMKGETCVAMKKMNPTLLYESIEEYRVFIGVYSKYQFFSLGAFIWCLLLLLCSLRIQIQLDTTSHLFVMQYQEQHH